MKTLQELIALTATVAEARRSDADEDDHMEKARTAISKMDMDDLVDAWQNANSYHSFEGERGVDRLGELADAIGYDGLDGFFGDNPGLLEEFIDFAKQYKMSMKSGGTADDELDDWLDAQGIHSFEGDRGIDNMDKVARQLGYSNFTDALGDNSGYIEKCIDWVKERLADKDGDFFRSLAADLIANGWEPDGSDDDEDEDDEKHDAPAAKGKDGDDAAHLSGKGPVDVADVFKFFPKKAAKVLSVLGAQERLTLDGKKVGGGAGSITHDLEEAVKAYFADGYEAEVSFDMDLPGSLTHSGEDETVDVEYKQPFDAKDAQNDVNLEDMWYDPRTGHVFGVFGVHLAEDAFNEAFDEKFEDETGQAHDYDDPEHQEVYQQVWKKWTDGKLSYQGQVFSFDPKTGEVDPQPHLTADGDVHSADGSIRRLKADKPTAVELPHW